MAQYARPTGDVSTGSWTVTPLWSKIEETPYSDTDYVTSPKNASSNAFEVSLNNVTDPNVHTNHIIRYRARCDKSSNGTIVVSLVQGTTVIRSYDPGYLTTSFAPYSFTLTEAEAANITASGGNYTDLRLRFVGSCTANAYDFVSWCEFEVPDATQVYQFTTTVANASSTAAVDVLVKKNFSVTLNLASASAVVDLTTTINLTAAASCISNTTTVTLENTISASTSIATTTAVSGVDLLNRIAPVAAINIASTSSTFDCDILRTLQTTCGLVSTSASIALLGKFSESTSSDLSSSSTPIDLTVSTIIPFSTSIASTSQSSTPTLSKTVGGSVSITLSTQTTALLVSCLINLTATAAIQGSTTAIDLDEGETPPTVDGFEYWNRGSVLLRPVLSNLGLPYWNRGQPFSTLPQSVGGIDVFPDFNVATLTLQAPTVSLGVGLTVSVETLVSTLTLPPPHSEILETPSCLTVGTTLYDPTLSCGYKVEAWWCDLSASQAAPEIHPGLSITDVSALALTSAPLEPSTFAQHDETVSLGAGVTVDTTTGGYALFRSTPTGDAQGDGWVFQNPWQVPAENFSSIYDQWTNCTVTSEFPPDAFMFLIQVTNTATSKDYTFGVRPDGSTETRTATIYRNTSEWLVVSVIPGSSRIFEVYVDNSALVFYVVGYCRHFNWPGPDGTTYTADKSFSTTGSYQSVDLRWRDVDNPNYKWLAPYNAKAALLAVHNTSNSNYQYAVRRPDFGYDYYYDIYQNTCQLAVVGLSTNKSFDMKIESANVDCYYIGSGSSDFHILDSGPQLLPATLTYNAWVDFDISSYVASGSRPVVGVILQAYNNTGGTVGYNVRKNGSTTSITAPINFYAACQKFIMVGVDSNRVFEAWQTASGMNVWIVGYIVSNVYAPGFFWIDSSLYTPSAQPASPLATWTFPATALSPVGWVAKFKGLQSGPYAYPYFDWRPVSAGTLPHDTKSFIYTARDTESYFVGFRPTDTSYEDLNCNLYYNYAMHHYCPLDSDGKCEQTFTLMGGANFFHKIQCFCKADHGFLTYYDKSNTSTGFQTKTASEIPSGADTIFLVMVNRAALTTYLYYVESTDSVETAYLGNIQNDNGWMAISAVNASKQFDQYVSDLYVDSLLQGYGRGDVHAFARTVDDPSYNLTFTQEDVDAWSTFDCTDVVPPEACGLILWWVQNTYSGAISLRIDEDTPSWYAAMPAGMGQTHVVGLNYDMCFDIYISQGVLDSINAGGKVKIIGYFMGSKKATLVNPRPLILGTELLPLDAVQGSPPTAWEGWIFLTNVINITSRITEFNTWTTVDLSSDVPAGAKGIIYQITQSNYYDELRCVRPTGSSYNELCKTDCSYANFGYVPLDDNRRFQAYMQTSGRQTMYVVGYSSENHVLDPWVTKSVFRENAYTCYLHTIDAANELPSDASCVVLDVFSSVDGPSISANLVNDHFGSSTWPSWSIAGTAGQSYHRWLFAPVSGEEFEFYSTATAGTTFNILSYFTTSEFVALPQPPGITVPQSSTWCDIDVSPYVAGDATGVLLYTPGWTFRKNGSTQAIYDDNEPGWGIVGLDRNGVFEMWRSSTSAVAYLMGYFRGHPSLGAVNVFPDCLTVQLNLFDPDIDTVCNVYAEKPGIAILMSGVSINYGLSYDPNIVEGHLQLFDPTTILDIFLEPSTLTINMSLYDPAVFQGMITQNLSLVQYAPTIGEGLGVSVSALTLNCTLQEPEALQLIPVSVQTVLLSTQDPVVSIPKVFGITETLEVSSSLETPNIYGKAVDTPYPAGLSFSMYQPYLPDHLIGLESLEGSLSLLAPGISSFVSLAVESLTVSTTLWDPDVLVIVPIDAALTVNTTLLSPTVYYEAAPWVFPNTALHIWGSWYLYTWVTVGVSAVYPSNTKGLVIHAENKALTDHTLAFRRIDSAAARQATSQIHAGTHLWYFVPLDNNLEFQMYTSGDDDVIDIRAVGYCTSNIFLSNDIDKSVSTAGSYQTITFDDAGFLANPSGIFLELHNAGSSDVNQWAIRKYGTSYDSYLRGQGHNTQMIVAPVDAQRQCEMKISSTDIDVWAWGSLDTDCGFFASPVALNLSNTSSWTDVDISSYVTSGTVAAILELVNNTVGSVTMHVRKKGSSDFSDTTALNIPAYNHIHAIVGLDSSSKFQIIGPTSSYTIYLLGYIMGGARQFVSPILEASFTLQEPTAAGSPDVTVTLNPNYLSFYGPGVTLGIGMTLEDAEPPVNPAVNPLGPGGLTTSTGLITTAVVAHSFDEDAYSCDMTYSFSSDVSVTDTGVEQRFSTFSQPKREVVVSLGVLDSTLYSELERSLVQASTLATIPVWAFRTPLTANASATATSLDVDDVSEFSVLDFLMVARDLDANFSDCVVISGIANPTISLATAITNDYNVPSVTDFVYDPLSAHVAPCVTGYAEVEGEDICGDASLFMTKVRIDGGAWTGAQIPGSISDFLEKPASSEYANPAIERDLLGNETGVLALRSYEPSAKLSFTLEWHFIDTAWKTCRDVFFYSRGRSKTFRMPTWKAELRAQAQSAQGSSTLTLNTGFDKIWTRFNTVMVVPRYGDPFITTLQGYIGNDTFTLTASLPSTVYPGDQVSLCPTVRFSEDTLEFSFRGKDLCIVKATFLEVRP